MDKTVTKRLENVYINRIHVLKNHCKKITDFPIKLQTWNDLSKSGMAIGILCYKG